MRYKNVLLVVLGAVLLMAIAPLAVDASTYVRKSTGDQALWNVGGLWSDSGSTTYFGSCSSGWSIRAIHPDGSVTCEYDDYGTGTMSWWFLYGDSGSVQQVDNGESVDIEGGTDGIDSSSGATNTVTLTFDGSELATDDLSDSTISFSTSCSGNNMVQTSGTNLGCAAESDPYVNTYTSNNVCYGGSSVVDCNEGANFYWDSTNNRLGLGTSSPSQRLHVSGTGNERIRVQTSAGQKAGYDLAYSSNYWNMTLDGADSYNLNFIPGSGNPAMTFMTNGRVGINDNGPDCTLQARYSTGSSTYLCAGYRSGSDEYGIRGITTGSGIGVYGVSSIAGEGVFGFGTVEGARGEAAYTAGGPSTIYGVYGTASGATTNWGGYFYPDVYIADDLLTTYINYLSGDASTLYIGSGSWSVTVYSHNSNAGFSLYGGMTLSGSANDNHIIRIPTISSGSANACSTTWEGAMYWNVSSARLMYCISGVWRTEYTPMLLDSKEVGIDYIGERLLQRDGLANLYLPGYSVGSDFSFYLSNAFEEAEFFDEVHLNMRCYHSGNAMTTKRFDLADDSPDRELLEEDDDRFLVLKEGEKAFIRFTQPSQEDVAGCDDVEFEFVMSGYYEKRAEEEGA